jgi:hypothetical protein
LHDIASTGASWTRREHETLRAEIQPQRGWRRTARGPTMVLTMRLSRELRPVPPEHPLFSGQVFFVFQHELPEDEPEQDESEDVED